MSKRYCLKCYHLQVLCIPEAIESIHAGSKHLPVYTAQLTHLATGVEYTYHKSKPINNLLQLFELTIAP